MNRYRMMSDTALASADRFNERRLKVQIVRVSKTDAAFKAALDEAMDSETEVERRAAK